MLETTAATLFARLCFVHFKGASIEVGAVGTFDRGFHVLLGVHSHEGKATRAAGLTILGDVSVSDGTILGEEGFEILLSRVERHVAYIHFHIN